MRISFGRTGRRWKVDIKMDDRDIWCGFENWIHLNLDAVEWWTFVVMLNFLITK